MDAALLSSLGSVLCGLAAWASLWSPSAKERKRRREADQVRAREVHEALFGREQRVDNSGALIDDGHSGLLADMRVVRAKLNAPLLNGKGDDLIRTVDRLDVRTARQGRRIANIERRLDDGSPADSGLIDWRIPAAVGAGLLVLSAALYLDPHPHITTRIVRPHPTVTHHVTPTPRVSLAPAVKFTRPPSAAAPRRTPTARPTRQPKPSPTHTVTPHPTPSPSSCVEVAGLCLPLPTVRTTH